MRLGAEIGAGNFGKSGDLLRARGAGRTAAGREQAAGAHGVDGGEDAGKLHGDAQGTVATEGVARQAAAVAAGQRAVTGVDIGDQFAGDVGFPVAGGDRGGVATPAEGIEGVGHDDDHLGGASRGGAIENLGQVDPVFAQAEPLVIAVGEAVEHIDHGVAALGVFCIAGGQVDGDVAGGRVADEVAFQAAAVDAQALRGSGRRVGGEGQSGEEQSAESQHGSMIRDRDSGGKVETPDARQAGTGL